jgi:hypothetical protein
LLDLVNGNLQAFFEGILSDWQLARLKI